MNLFIIPLALIGLWISLYFTGVYYKWFEPNVLWIPKICQMSQKTCLSVLDTPRAKIFGVPNSVFGLFVYTYFILDVFSFSPTLGMLLAALSFSRSLYLAYSLIFVTKIPCPLCFTSHAINFLLFLIYFRQVFFPS